MTKEEVLQHDKKFRYMLLSRMQSDCEYYLNYGNRNQNACGLAMNSDKSST